MASKARQARLFSPPFTPSHVVAMSRIEVVVPSFSPLLPETLLAVFPAHLWCDAGGSNCFAIFGCDLSRSLTDQEEQALMEAVLSQEIRFYDVFTR